MFKSVKGVYSKKFIEEHSIPITESGCWLWECKDNDGDYVIVDGVKTKVDRVVYESFYTGIPENSDVVHDCHIDCCVNPSHMHLKRKRPKIDLYHLAPNPQILSPVYPHRRK